MVSKELKLVAWLGLSNFLFLYLKTALIYFFGHEYYYFLKLFWLKL